MTVVKEFDPVHAAQNGYTKEDWDAVDLPELTDEELAQMRPLREVDPELHARLMNATFPQKEAEPAVMVRLDGDLARRLQASGPGWERRVNEILRRWADEADKAA